MIYLCCDTNIWINISNSEEPTRLLDFLHEEISKNNIRLILPTIIAKEWERNKQEKIIGVINKNISEQKRILHKLSHFLKQENKNSFDEFMSDEKIKDLEKKAIELKNDITKYETNIIAKANLNISKVEEIFNHATTIRLETDEITSLKVIKIFSEKEFPFNDTRDKKSRNEVEAKNKNNFADCLLFYQFINYVGANSIKGAHFVTSNKSDFYPNDHLHEVYLKEINSVDAHFHKSLSDAINKSLEKEIVTLNEIKRIELIAKQRNKKWTESTCLACEIDDDNEDNFSVIYNRVLHFHEDVQISDERVVITNPRQTKMFAEDIFSDNYTPPPRSKDFLYTATCQNCGTNHFLCPECEEVINLDEIEINKTQKCENCELAFIYKQDVGKKGDIENEKFLILKDGIKCSGCGDEFISRGDNSDLCEECEKFYATSN